MIGFMVNIFPFRSRVSFKEAFEGLELGEGKLSCPVLRGPGGRKAAWLLGDRSVNCGRKYRISTNRTSGESARFHMYGKTKDASPRIFPSFSLRAICGTGETNRKKTGGRTNPLQDPPKANRESRAHEGHATRGMSQIGMSVQLAIGSWKFTATANS